MNFKLQISSKCGQGGDKAAKISINFADVINGSSQREVVSRLGRPRVRTCNHEARSNEEEGIKRRRTDGRTSGSHSFAVKCTLLPSLVGAIK